MDLAKLGDKVVCSCKGGPHTVVSGASSALVDGMPIARMGDKSSCGAAIASGASWYSIEGAPAAIHGSPTTCGGHVESSATAITGSPHSAIAVSTLTGKGGAPRGKHLPGDAPATFLKHGTEPYPKYQSFSIPYLKNRRSYILAEGVGVHASYTLKGHVTLRGDTLTVSGMGKTAASHLGSVDWFVSATLHDEEIDIEKKNLSMEVVSAWPDDDFDPIGHAIFSLPVPPRRLSLILTGGYFFSNGSGHAASGTVDILFEIEVETQ